MSKQTDFALRVASKGATKKCPVCGEPCLLVMRQWSSNDPRPYPHTAEFAHEKRPSGWRRGLCVVSRLP